MFRSSMFVLLAAAGLLAQSPVAYAKAPSLTELLEKAIYTEETVGDLDSAIKLYEQVAAKHDQNAEASGSGSVTSRHGTSQTRRSCRSVGSVSDSG